MHPPARGACVASQGGTIHVPCTRRSDQAPPAPACTVPRAARSWQQAASGHDPTRGATIWTRLCSSRWRSTPITALAPEERTLGQRFLVDVEVDTDLHAAGRTDDLEQTVDYGALYRTVRDAFEAPACNLIEAAAERVARMILLRYARVERVRVRVQTPWRFTGAHLAYAAVRIQRERSERKCRAARRRAVSALTRADILALLAADPPLVDALADPSAQVQPNGLDLTLDVIWQLRAQPVSGARSAACARTDVGVGASSWRCWPRAVIWCVSRRCCGCRGT